MAKGLMLNPMRKTKKKVKRSKAKTVVCKRVKKKLKRSPYQKHFSKVRAGGGTAKQAARTWNKTVGKPTAASKKFYKPAIVARAKPKKKAANKTATKRAKRRTTSTRRKARPVRRRNAAPKRAKKAAPKRAKNRTAKRRPSAQQWRKKYDAAMRRAGAGSGRSSMREKLLAGVSALNPFARKSVRKSPKRKSTSSTSKAGKSKPGSGGWRGALESGAGRGTRKGTRAGRKGRQKMARKKTKRKKAKRKTARKKTKRRAKARKRTRKAAPKRRKRARKAANKPRPKRRKRARKAANVRTPKRRKPRRKKRAKRRANPLYRTKKGRFSGRKSKKRVTVAGRSPRAGRRTNPVRYPMAYRPRSFRNPLYNTVAVGRPRNVTDMAKSLVSVAAMKDAVLITGGLVAGAVLPTVIVKGLRKIGLMTGSVGTVAQVGIGVAASAVAGIATGVLAKSRRAGCLVAASGIAGMASVIIIDQIQRRLPALTMTGLGQSGESSVRRAVEAEIRKNLGMGDFLTESSVEAQLTGLGARPDVETGAAVFGDFPTVEMVEQAPPVAGMGLAGAETPNDMAESMDTFGYESD